MNRRKLLLLGSIAVILPILFTFLLVSQTAHASTTQATYFTSYGYNDNDDGMGHYGNAIIANPCLHQIATETSGYYNDPITYATDDRETAYCVKIYVPYLQKYFIHEDGCAECTVDWNNGQKWRTDLWMGDNTYMEDPNTLYPCEDKVTRNDNMIINPSSNYVVDPTRLFHNNVCTAVLHGSTPITVGGGPTATPPPSGGAFLAGKTISLKASVNNSYVSTRIDTAGNPLQAKATAVQAWEKFVVVDMGGGNVALRAVANNNYVTANLNAANAPLQATATVAQGWEIYRLVDRGGGNLAIKSVQNGLYVTADLNMANTPLEAKAATVQGWEVFQYTTY